MVEHRLVETPSADPALLYQNALVVLDRQKGINNGEPFLHAAWIGAVAPGPGETVTQVGAGGGYYTAILSMLVLPGGKVVAYEIDAALAQAAQRNLAPFENVTRRPRQDAVTAELPPSDIIYVNAGVVAPPRAMAGGAETWRAPGVSRGGRPTVSALPCWPRGSRSGFAVRILGGAWFIPCSGASDEAITVKQPSSKRGAAGPVDRAQRGARAGCLGGRGLSGPVVLVAGARQGRTPADHRAPVIWPVDGCEPGHHNTPHVSTSFWSPSAAP